VNLNDWSAIQSLLVFTGSGFSIMSSWGSFRIYRSRYYPELRSMTLHELLRKRVFRQRRLHSDPLKQYAPFQFFPARYKSTCSPPATFSSFAESSSGKSTTNHPATQCLISTQWTNLPSLRSPSSLAHLFFCLSWTLSGGKQSKALDTGTRRKVELRCE
jgi:hypothetical protein